MKKLLLAVAAAFGMLNIQATQTSYLSNLNMQTRKALADRLKAQRLGNYTPNVEQVQPQRFQPRPLGNYTSYGINGLTRPQATAQTEFAQMQHNVRENIQNRFDNRMQSLQNNPVTGSVASQTKPAAEEGDYTYFGV